MNPASGSDSPAGLPGEAKDPLESHTQTLRVLVVEDEFLVGIMLQEDLRAMGCTVVGPFTSVKAALEGMPGETIDVAVLDINLGGEMVYPLADDLQARGIPFMFLSGYVTANLPERFRTAPRLAKPYHPAALGEEVMRVAGGR